MPAQLHLLNPSKTPTATPIDLNNHLALSARSGNIQSRNRLYLRHADLIRNRTIPAQRLADKLEKYGAPINSDDVQQQCFLIFCRLLQTWDPVRTPFATYLSDAISREAYTYVREIQHLRSIRVHLLPHNPEQPQDLIDNSPNDPDSPSTTPTHLHLITEDNTQEILNNDYWNSIIAHLREDWARLIHQRFWEEKTTQQIAQTTGQSRRTIDRTLQTALSALKEATINNYDLP